MRIHPLYAKKSKVFKKGMLSLDFFGKSGLGLDLLETVEGHSNFTDGKSVAPRSKCGILPLRQAQGQNDNSFTSIPIVKVLKSEGPAVGRVSLVMLTDLIIRDGGKLLCQLRETNILIVLMELGGFSWWRGLDKRICWEIRRKIFDSCACPVVASPECTLTQKCNRGMAEVEWAR